MGNLQYVTEQTVHPPSAAGSQLHCHWCAVKESGIYFIALDNKEWATSAGEN